MPWDQDTSASPADTDEQDLDVSSAAASTAEDENPDSSPEQRETEDAPEESLSDVVSKALEGEKPEGEEDDDKGGDAEDDDPEKAEQDEAGKGESEKAKPDSAEADDEEEDDGSDVEAGQKIPYDRFKKVIEQRNTWKEQVQSVEQERDQYRQGHEQYEALQTYMREHELRTQDVVEALQIAAAMNRNPAEAARMLAPKMQQLQQYTGEILPSDLQQQVENGELTAEHARDLVRQRNETARLHREHQRTQAERQQQDQQVQVQQAQQAMARAADQTVAELRNSDPEYDQKASLIRTTLESLIAQRRPQTAQEATALVKEAHQRVTQEVVKFRPRREVRPGPSSTSGGSATSAAREPQSMEEAIQLAMQQTSE